PARVAAVDELFGFPMPSITNTWLNVNKQIVANCYKTRHCCPNAQLIGASTIISRFRGFFDRAH
ncbi:MAG TPA: hypothetical protein VNT29_02165, partial [Candidatus Limnocylindrales bacterium]|nr:hypothetical protein [Candidatus Limnocylindrales bacterium]